MVFKVQYESHTQSQYPCNHSSESIQRPSNDHPTTVQQPSNNHPTTIQLPLNKTAITEQKQTHKIPFTIASLSHTQALSTVLLTNNWYNKWIFIIIEAKYSQQKQQHNKYVNKVTT